MNKLLSALFINAELVAFSPNRSKYAAKINFGTHQDLSF